MARRLISEEEEIAARSRLGGALVESINKCIADYEKETNDTVSIIYVNIAKKQVDIQYCPVSNNLENLN